jgi:predicted nucleic acid-binding protein
MLIVDASCLYEVVADGAMAARTRARLALDSDQVAPHIVDAEVLGVIRRDLRLGRLDRTAALQAVEDLRDWPADRYGHRLLLERAWELQDRVRIWDGLYVALAEALGGTLLTLDRRLARVSGLGCPVELLELPASRQR